VVESVPAANADNASIRASPVPAAWVVARRLKPEQGRVADVRIGRTPLEQGRVRAGGIVTGTYATVLSAAVLH